MKKLFFLLIGLIVTHSVCYAYDDVLDVGVGETFTVNGGSYIYIQAVLWDYDPAIFDAVSVSGYSTKGSFKAIKPSPSVGTVIQATIYYYQDGTTSTGLNKAVASWKVYVTDESSECTVSLPVSMEMKVNEVRTVSATTSSTNYSGGFWWNTEPSIVEIISQDGNTAKLRAKSPGKVFIYVTLDNGNSDRMYVSVSKASGGGSDIEDCIETDEYPIEYYDLQGLPIQNPCKGQLVIKRQGASVLKIIYNGD